MVPPISGKSDLVSWWWFDEGKGTQAIDSISGGLGNLSGGTSWSLASIYGTSLTFQNSGDHAELGLPASGWDDNNFSINFWFRRTEESFTWSSEQMSNVMLSLANEENCSIQIGTKGPSVEVYLASLGKTSRTTINANVQDGTWHYVSLSYDSSNSSGNELEVYLDGNLIGSTSVYAGALVRNSTMKWFLAMANQNAPADGRFIGNIDDFRIFNKPISLLEHQSFYNLRKGDLNLAVDAFYPSSTHSNPVVVDLNFTRYGMPWTVDFNQSLLSLSNAVLNDINASNDSSFRLELNATKDPTIIEVLLPEGIAKDSSRTENKALSFKIGFGRPVTRLENLVAWWTFDEGNGTTVTDYMNGYVGDIINSMDGNISFDNTVSKFGYALRFS